jgi:hypothetical protein
MNKIFEEQVKNQVQYPEYIEPYKNQKKLQETKNQINNMKTIISNMKQELIDIKSKEKNVKKQMMGKFGKLVDKTNNFNKLKL